MLKLLAFLTEKKNSISGLRPKSPYWSQQRSRVSKIRIGVVVLCILAVGSTPSLASKLAHKDKPIHDNQVAGIDLKVARVGPKTVYLTWNKVKGVHGYNIYRSTSLGWVFDTSKDTWIKDYSGYTKLNSSPIARPAYLDRTVSNGTTYFYVVEAIYSNAEGEKSRPVAVRPPVLEYDAALACNGGYAWAITNDTLSSGHIDTPQLIDGNNTTEFHPINFSNPKSSIPYFRRGFQKITLASRVLVKNVEIVQDAGYSKAKIIKIITDDGTVFTFDVSADIKDSTWGHTCTSSLPLNKKTSYLNIYVEDRVTGNLNNPYGPYWHRASAFTADNPNAPATSPEEVGNANVVVDFNQEDGSLTRSIASTELQAHVGRPSGWELKLWPYWKALKPNMLRTNIGDGWPHNYGEDKMLATKLSKAIDDTATNTIYIDDASELTVGSVLQVDSEYMLLNSKSGNTLTVTRGYDGTDAETHLSGTDVYFFVGVRNIMRATELLPEFTRIRYDKALSKNITDPTQATFTFSRGSFSVGDIIQIDQELMKVTDVTGNTLTVERGYEGTTKAQHWYPIPIFKLVNYQATYSTAPNDPKDPANYDFHYWDRVLDQIVADAGCTPWIIASGPNHFFNSRGTITSITSANGGSNNILNDSSKDWWIKQYGGSFTSTNLVITSGDAKGKAFYVKTNTTTTLELTKSRSDTATVDLIAEGVKAGDSYIVRVGPRASGLTNQLHAPTKEKWQDYCDFWYMVVKHIVERYPNTPFYLELGNEPDILGNWNDEVYLELFTQWSKTIRTGGPHFAGGGFSPNQVKLAGGATATQLKNGFNFVKQNYLFAEELIKTPYIDVVSHHSYGMASRRDKRTFAWEVAFLKRIASEQGKTIEVIDSENNALSGGAGTGYEGYTQLSKVQVPYWGNAFINYFYGDQGEDGRYLAAIQFRLFSQVEGNFGLFYDGKACPGYWAIKLFADHTTATGQDTFAKTLQGGDAYGWIQTMAIKRPNGEKKLFIVNKKNTPINVNLSMLGVSSISNAKIFRVNGDGLRRTVSDGYQALDTQGIVSEDIPNSTAYTVTVEPCSFNVISFNADGGN